MDREIDSPVFGMRLKQARLTAGYSQKKLGIQAGIDPSVASTRVNRYELGVHKPDFEIARTLANVLNVPVAFFYTPEEDLAGIIFRFRKSKIGDRKEIARLLEHIAGPPEL